MKNLKFCKLCGSSKNDMRSGICDKCAFPKKKKSVFRNLSRKRK